MEYNLVIDKIEVIESQDNLTNIIKRVSWTYTGTQEGHSYVRKGGNNFTYDPNNFTPFEQLTTAQVTQWCLTKMQNDGMLSFLQESIVAEAAEQPEPVLVERTLENA